MGDASGIRGLAGIRCGGLLRSCCKNEFKEPEKFAHLRGSNDKGRQKTQRKIVSAIDQQAALHGFADKRRTFDREFDTDDQAFAADLVDEGEFCRKLREAFAQFGAAQADVVEQFFVLDDAEKLEAAA